MGPAGDASWKSLSSGALLEPSRPCAIFSPRLCRCDRVLQQAYRARPHAPRFPSGGVGAARQSHRGRRTHPRGAAKGAGFYCSSLRRHAALSKPNRWGARARGPAEGGVAGLGTDSIRASAPRIAPGGGWRPCTERRGSVGPQSTGPCGLPDGGSRPWHQPVPASAGHRHHHRPAVASTPNRAHGD